MIFYTPQHSPSLLQPVRTSTTGFAGSTYPGVGGLTTLKALDTGPGTRIRPAQGNHSHNYKFISAIKERKLLMPNDSSKSSANSSSKTLSTAERIRPVTKLLAGILEKIGEALGGPMLFMMCVRTVQRHFYFQEYFYF